VTVTDTILRSGAAVSMPSVTVAPRPRPKAGER